MKHKITLLFLVTSFSMATTPIWAVTNNSGIPVKLPASHIHDIQKAKEEKSEEKGSWFTTKNVVGTALVVALIAAGLVWKFGEGCQGGKGPIKKT